MSQSTTSTAPAPAAMPLSTPSESPPMNSLNILSQKLNNSAALCIEVGQYDRAIFSLQRALRLSEKHTSQMKSASSKPVTVSSYTLDGCIAFSDANSLFSKTGGKSPRATVREVNEASTSTSVVRNENNNKRRKIEVPEKESKLDSNTADSNKSVANFEDTNSNNYYVFSRPIRVPRQGDEMGSVLFLIILFNLALAHHLKASTDMSSKGSAKAIEKSLMLYQLVLNYWSKLQQRMEESYDTSSMTIGNKTNHYSSIWFRMILHNNLAQIYNWTQKTAKGNDCLKDLLSTVMVATDQSILHGKGNLPKGFVRDMEGFLANTAALTIHERCAEAA